MKSRVLGLACAAGLAAGCQSPATQALTRWKASQKDSSEVAQASHESKAGLPGPSKKPVESPVSYQQAFATGDSALQQFYNEPDNKTNNLRRSQIQFEAAAKADPSSAAAQHRLAIIADLQERFADSENHYRMAMSLDPSNGKIVADLGWSYMVQERWVDAERTLQRAVQLDPNYPRARENLAKARQRLSPTSLAQISPQRDPRSQMAANQPAAVLPQGAPPSGRDYQQQQQQMAAAQRDPRMGQQQQQWPPLTTMTPDNEGEYLRQQLAMVDHQGEPQQGVPMTIDRNQRPMASQGTQNWGPQAGAMPMSQPGSVANDPRWNGAQPQPVDSRLAQGPGPSSQPNPRAFHHYEPPGAAPRPAALPPYVATNPTNQQGNDPARGAYGQQPSNYMIQRTQGLQSPGASDQALYQAPALPTLPGQPSNDPRAWNAGQNGMPSTAPPTNYAQGPPPLAGNQTSQDNIQRGNALDQTRKAAALMGLGIGPGNMFSSIEQQAPRLAPGNGTQFGGMGFPQTPIRSTDLAPIPDLRQNPSFFQEQGLVPSNNNMGQQMPAGTSSTMTLGTRNDPNAGFNQRFVAPTAGQAPQMSQPHLSQPQTGWLPDATARGMSGYDDTRRQVDQQAQQAMRNTWANSPTGFIASPSSGVPVDRPAPPSQMMNDGYGRQPVAPEPYQPGGMRTFTRPIEIQKLPAVTPTVGRNPVDNYSYYQQDSPQPQYRDGIVVPDQYPRGR